MNAPGLNETDISPHRYITCLVDELRPHPGYARNSITVPLSRLSQLARSSIPIDREPLLVTRERTILNGYVRWELARLRYLSTLKCVEQDISEDEALLWLLQKHHRSDGLNAYCRILLALELEPWFKIRARSNQGSGGKNKGSSKLTKAERLDVRAKIAAAAGACAGNVTKVKCLVSSAHPDVQEALRCGSVSIHRAWGWLQKPETQLERLAIYQNRHIITRTVNSLLRQQQSANSSHQSGVQGLIGVLEKLDFKQISSLPVLEIKSPGKFVLLSTELYRDLPSQGNLTYD